MQKRLFSLSVAVFLLSTLAWAQTLVKTDADIRAAIHLTPALCANKQRSDTPHTGAPRQ